MVCYGSVVDEMRMLRWVFISWVKGREAANILRERKDRGHEIVTRGTISTAVMT